MLAWALGRWLHLSPVEQLHPSPDGVIVGVAATLPMLAALSWILNTRWEPARQLVDLVVEQLGPVLAGRSALQLALLAALAGLAEEVLFRGVAQVGLSRVLPEGWALVVSSVLFGLVHFVSRTYAVFATVVGLYLGGLFLLGDGLLAPIVTHALYDFVALIYVVRRYRESRTGPD
ncbi:MAG: lysostaphin resistance A-like protein [Gemmatimonadales bacterium]